MEHFFGAIILAALQVRVHYEVVGVGFVHEAVFVVSFGGVGGLDGSDLGVDILLPHAEAREDVAGHVGGVRAGWRDFSVVLGCGEAVFRHGGVVAGVNDVVHYARIVRVFGVERREYGQGLVVMAEAGVVGRFRCEQREGVKRAGIDVVGILGIERAHGG